MQQVERVQRVQHQDEPREPFKTLGPWEYPEWTQRVGRSVGVQWREMCKSLDIMGRRLNIETGDKCGKWVMRQAYEGRGPKGVKREAYDLMQAQYRGGGQVPWLQP